MSEPNRLDPTPELPDDTPIRAVAWTAVRDSALTQGRAQHKSDGTAVA